MDRSHNEKVDEEGNSLNYAEVCNTNDDHQEVDVSFAKDIIRLREPKEGHPFRYPYHYRKTEQKKDILVDRCCQSEFLLYRIDDTFRYDVDYCG